MNDHVDECEQTLLVQADFDGELEASRAAALVEHVAQCAQCQRVSEQLERSRTLLRDAQRYPVPQELRSFLDKTLQAQAPAKQSRPLVRAASRAPLLGWATALAASVALAVVMLTPRTPDVEAQLLASHVRSLQLESHLIDVESSDHHTVRPWFAGKVDFAPPVKELAGEGFPLAGGRIDVIGGRTVAVLVYRAGRHVVSVYLWPERAGLGDLPRPQRDEGFNLRRWVEDGLVVSCISDLSADELERFEHRWRAQ
jgi:anti-sigma factor RsiW